MTILETAQAAQAAASQDEVQKQAVDESQQSLATAASTTASVAAEKAFNVPEILEHILSFLDNADLLRVYRVCRQFFDAIETSTKLQRKLGLVPAPESDIFIPIEKPESNIDIVTDPCETGSSRYSSSIQLIIQGTSSCGKMGARYRSILGFQPPIQEMNVFPHCRADTVARGLGPEEPTELLRATEGSGGITIGDINEAVSRISWEHRTCPNAPVSADNDDGVVDSVNITFMAEIEARETDPLFQAALAERRRREQIGSLFFSAISYLDARDDAQDRGVAIPTYEEWKGRI